MGRYEIAGVAAENDGAHERITALTARLDGLDNDALYWDLRRTYGDYSGEVLQHLEACARHQGVE